jgi:hypothetical protein
LDEYVVCETLVALGVLSKENLLIKSLLDQGQCPNELETGVSLEGACPQNFSPIDLSGLHHHYTVVDLPRKSIGLVPVLFVHKRFLPPLPERILAQAIPLQTVRLLL